jgi:Omp85 superfamily domain
MLRSLILTVSGRFSGCLHYGLIIALAAGLFGSWPASAIAQTSRAQVIAEEQKAKAAKLSPEGPSAGEKVLVVIMRSPLLGGRAGLYPWIARVYPGTGLGVGAGYHKQLPHGGRVNALAAGSFGDSFTLNAQARLPEISRGLLAVTVDAGKLVAKGLKYYGRGPLTVKDKSLLYDLDLAEAGASAVLRPVRWFHLVGGYKWLTVDGRRPSSTLPDGLFSTSPGLKYNVVQAGAAVDWRTSPGYSTRGGLYRVTWSSYSETQDRPFSFQSIEYEAIQLLPLLREQFVLAFWGLATVSMTDSGNEVPFTLAPTLGGTEMLRGFNTRRFTDRNRLLLAAEYRWRPSRFLDMAVFFDAGKVAARRTDLSLSHLETDWGIGARLHGPTFTAVRVEVAKSREGWRLVIAAHQAF